MKRILNLQKMSTEIGEAGALGSWTSSISVCCGDKKQF